MNKMLNVTPERERERSAAEAGAACCSFPPQPISSFPGGGGKQFRGLVSPFRFFKTKFFYKRFSAHTKIFAFTLAEVLITLAIIGVVAAMTIPGVIQNTHKKELESMFKKQFAALNDAVQLIKYEDGLEFTSDNYGSAFKKTLAAKFSVLSDCGSINYSTGCVLLEDDGTFSYYKSYTNNTLYRGYFDDGGFITSDGAAFFLELGSQSKDTGYLVTIDVNGYTRKPNKMGHDLFTFQITKEGEVLPMGAEGTYFESKRDDYCSKTSTYAYNGYTCAYFAQTEKDYFKNLP